MNGQMRTWLRGSGVGFSAVLIAGGLLARSGGIQDPSQRIVAALEDASLTIMIAGYLLTLSAALLVVFSQALAGTLRRHGGDDSWSPVAASGGVLAAAMLMMSAMAAAGAAERAAAEVGIGGEAATGLVVLSTILMGKGFPIGAGVMIGASGLSHLGERSPHPFDWLSLGLAVGLLSPANFLFVYFVPVWTALSGWLLPRGNEPGEALK